MDMFVLTSAEHPPPPRRHPGPHLQLQISRASTPFKQIGVTGCSCQCHHLPKWDHVSSLPPNLTWEAVVWECCRERHFRIRKLQQRRWLACKGGPALTAVMSRCSLVSVTRRIKGNDVGRRGFVFSRSLHLHGGESTNWTQPIRTQEIHNLFLPAPSA